MLVIAREPTNAWSAMRSVGVASLLGQLIAVIRFSRNAMLPIWTSVDADDMSSRAIGSAFSLSNAYAFADIAVCPELMTTVRASHFSGVSSSCTMIMQKMGALRRRFIV